MKYTNKFITLAFASTLSISLTSCGDKKSEDKTESNAETQQETKTHDSVSRELIANLNAMSDKLATIKDTNTATSTIPALTKIGFKLKMIKTDMEKLGIPSKEIQAKLEENHGTEMKGIMTKIDLTMNSLKISQPEAFGLIEKAMKTIMQ